MLIKLHSKRNKTTNQPPFEKSSVLRVQPDFCKSKKAKETFGQLDGDRGGFADPSLVLKFQRAQEGF